MYACMVPAGIRLRIKILSFLVLYSHKEHLVYHGISWYNLNYLENVDVPWYKTTNKNIILSYIDTHKERHAWFVMVYPAGIRLVIKILYVLFSSLLLL